MRFAHLKTHHRFERMRLRGLSGARDEFHLAAILQNLKILGEPALAATAEHSGRLSGMSLSGVEGRSSKTEVTR